MNITAINTIVRTALKEDAAYHDITTQTTIDRHSRSIARIIAGEKGVLCGTALVIAVFRTLDPKASFQLHAKEGQHFSKGKKVLTVKARTRAILSGERVALNLLSYASGIATLTSQFVKAAGAQNVKIMDTRKTLPGLRVLARMAVRCGGGVNHRFDLADMVMIKDNHRTVLNGSPLAAVIQQVRRKTSKKIIVEVDRLNQFREVLDAHPEVILLDNMTPQQLHQAVMIKRRGKYRTALEASGGITLQTIHKIAQTGVDRISIGALTHAARGIDFSLEISHG